MSLKYTLALRRFLKLRPYQPFNKPKSKLIRLAFIPWKYTAPSGQVRAARQIPTDLMEDVAISMKLQSQSQLFDWKQDQVNTTFISAGKVIGVSVCW